MRSTANASGPRAGSADAPASVKIAKPPPRKTVVQRHARASTSDQWADAPNCVQRCAMGGPSIAGDVRKRPRRRSHSFRSSMPWGMWNAPENAGRWRAPSDSAWHRKDTASSSDTTRSSSLGQTLTPSVQRKGSPAGSARPWIIRTIGHATSAVTSAMPTIARSRNPASPDVHARAASSIGRRSTLRVSAPSMKSGSSSARPANPRSSCRHPSAGTRPGGWMSSQAASPAHVPPAGERSTACVRPSSNSRGCASQRSRRGASMPVCGRASGVGTTLTSARSGQRSARKRSYFGNALNSASREPKNAAVWYVARNGGMSF